MSVPRHRVSTSGQTRLGQRAGAARDRAAAGERHRPIRTVLPSSVWISTEWNMGGVAVRESGIGKVMVGPLAGFFCGRAPACFRGLFFFLWEAR